MEEKTVHLNEDTKTKVFFVANTINTDEKVKVWLTHEEVECLYRAAKRSFLKSILMSLAKRL